MKEDKTLIYIVLRFHYFSKRFYLIVFNIIKNNTINNHNT